MPIHADNSPNIKWPLPEGKPAFSKTNIFPEEMLAEIKDIIKKESVWGPGSENLPGAQPYHTIPGRWTTEVEFPKHIWDHVGNLGKQSWEKDDLRLKVMWIARYQQYQGVTPYLWEHMDQPGTQYTLDICIESPGISSWGLLVDGEAFEEAPNSGVFFMGQQQTHSRPEYPVDNPEAYVVLLFCLFVSPDHWMYDIDAYDPEQAALLDELAEKYRYDGDIRYYEYSGHVPRFDGLPAGNKNCSDDCAQCYVIPSDFIDNLEDYIPRD